MRFLGAMVFSTATLLLAQITLFIWNARSADAFLLGRERGPFPAVKTIGNGWEPVTRTVVFEKEADDDGDKVQVGSKEYLEGFISSPIKDSAVPERGTGLEQALKLGGTVTVGLILLFLGFMGSNGLL